MRDIWAVVQSALSGLGVPVSAGRHQDSSGIPLPERFIVHTLISSPAEQHADDRETLRSYLVQVSYFDVAGLGGMPNIEGAMSAAGFCRAGARQLPISQETGHYGLALDFNLLSEE